MKSPHPIPFLSPIPYPYPIPILVLNLSYPLSYPIPIRILSPILSPLPLPIPILSRVPLDRKEQDNIRFFLYSIFSFSMGPPPFTVPRSPTKSYPLSDPFLGIGTDPILLRSFLLIGLGATLSPFSLCLFYPYSIPIWIVDDLCFIFSIGMMI